jgi:3-carboxy-cis,cis-muconate cycloisomerase
MPQEHERGLGGWQAEWDAMPALVLATAESAESIADALQRLVIDPDRMQTNLKLTRGLVMAEAVAMRLAPHLGKAEAHALVDAACRRAAVDKRDLQDVLAEEPAVTAILDRGALARALAPDQYLGAARTFVEHALNQHDARARGDA